MFGSLGMICASWFHTFCGCDKTLSDQMQFRGGQVFAGIFFPGHNPLSKEVMAGTQAGPSSRSHGGMLPAGLLRQVLKLVSYTAQHHLARDIAAHSELGALMLINNQDSYGHRHAHGPIRSKQFLSLRFPLR